MMPGNMLPEAVDSSKNEVDLRSDHEKFLHTYSTLALVEAVFPLYRCWWLMRLPYEMIPLFPGIVN